MFALYTKKQTPQLSSSAVSVAIAALLLMSASTVFIGGHAYAQTVSEYEESRALQKSIKRLAKKTKKGDRDAAMELAAIYIGSYRLEQRMKAVPLLKDLADKDDSEAMWRYVAASLGGYFGESSLQIALEYQAVLETEYPDAWAEFVRIDEHHRRAFNDRARAKSLYENAFPYCEQPGNNDGFLTDDDSHLSLRFIRVCLSRYSFLSNARERLMALSELARYECEIVGRPNAEKICTDSGYSLLATGNFEDATDLEFRSASHVATEMFDNHLLKLRPFVEGKAAQPVRKQVYERFVEAQRRIDQQQYDSALTIIDALVESAQSDDKLSDYEMVNALNYRGFLTYQLERSDETISAYEAILEMDAAGEVNMVWQTNKTLLQMYVLTEQYRKALKFFANIVAQAPAEIELIPREAVSAASLLPD